ncbi:SRPBCC domain-containing protein [Paenibacillus ferrarius]|uniref:SRPBCC domain-containing protein n=1 Tax=Paenibacillus ferrarius TaxID=1469647 RepID=UPI003D2B8E83
MSNNTIVSRVENDRVLVLERTFDAPRELVYSMFKEAEHLKHWWGPRGWEVPVCTVDFRPGGVWHYCMKCADPNQGDFYGMESWGKAIYKEMVEPDKIVYVDFFSDAEGNVNDAMPSTEVTLEFIDLGNGTTKLVNRGLYASAESLKTVIDMGMMQGITETWDRLAERLNAVKG